MSVPSLAPRAEPGRQGKPMRATTNNYRVLDLPKNTFYHYDKIVPEVKNKDRIPEIIQKLQVVTRPDIFTPAAAFDGRKNIFCFRKLKLAENRQTFIVDMANGRGPPRQNGRGVFSITVALRSQLEPAALHAILRGRGRNSSESQTVLQALNVIVHHYPKQGRPANPRAFFTGCARKIGVFEVWQGYFLSVRPAMGNLLINVDTSSAVMYQGGPLIDLVLGYLGYRDIRQLEQLSPEKNPRDWARLKSFVKHVHVEVDGGRTKIIKDIVKNGGEYVFEYNGQNGARQMKVAEYFARVKGVTLRYPLLPGIMSNRNTVFPMERCKVKEGQFYKKTPPSDVTSAMVTLSSKPKPQQRLNNITDGIEQRSIIENSYLSQAGIQISNTPEIVAGRLIDAPSVHYGPSANNPNGPSKPVLVQKGAGAWNVRDERFYKPAEVTLWAVISFHAGTSVQAAEGFAEKMQGCMVRRGMKVTTKPLVKQANGQGDVIAQLESLAKMAPSPISIIFIILPDSAADIRKAVKYWGDVDTRFRGSTSTQCLKASKVAGCNDQYLNNVALKVNIKCGGTNAIPKGPVVDYIRSTPTMFIGADVSHPGPGIARPSIASLVSSVDEYASHYTASLSVQEPRCETIADLKGMMQEALRRWGLYWGFKGAKGLWPKRVFFFRDGVSEGEYEKVVSQEIPQVQAALHENFLQAQQEAAASGIPSKLPEPAKLTFVIVGKRHHVRFFPTKEEVQQNNADRSGNCPAGFVVDTAITSPGAFDFFLQSHSGILGTSRPAHYTVLRDDNRMTSDIMQGVIFTLCHVYARATRSVSIPAPVYYADIVCSRADFHFEPHLNYMEEVSNDSKNEFRLQSWQEGFKQAKVIQKMYWM